MLLLPEFIFVVLIQNFSLLCVFGALNANSEMSCTNSKNFYYPLLPTLDGKNQTPALRKFPATTVTRKRIEHIGTWLATLLGIGL